MKAGLLKNILFVSMLFLVASCSGIPSTPEENEKYFKLGNPYKVDGKWYNPKYDPNYSETGMASWYGGEFHNRKTANGERFNKYEMTAAHKTLPLPSMVRVTNLENGKSAIVRVNDRGPFVSGRIIDVSKKAAQKLGFMQKGTAKVKITFLPEETAALFPSARHPMEEADYGKIHQKAPVSKVAIKSLIPDAEAKTPPVAKTPKNPSKKYSQINTKITPIVYVQAGSYSSKQNAREALKKVNKFGKTIIVPTRVKNKDIFRVRVGPLKDEETASQIVDNISSKGFKDAFVIID